MDVKRTAIVAGVASAVLIGTTLATVSTASADSACGPGATAKVSTQMIVNPLTGKTEKAVVTECPETRRGSGISGEVSSVTPSVGVDFRDSNGNRTTSGLSPRDQFEYLGEAKQGDGNDGTIIKVRQITKGLGGWGDRYDGWIPLKYAR